MLGKLVLGHELVHPVLVDESFFQLSIKGKIRSNLGKKRSCFILVASFLQGYLMINKWLSGKIAEDISSNQNGSSALVRSLKAREPPFILPKEVREDCRSILLLTTIIIIIIVIS